MLALRSQLKLQFKCGAMVSLSTNQMCAKMHQFHALPAHNIHVLFPTRRCSWKQNYSFHIPALSSSSCCLPVSRRQSRRYYLGRFKRRFRSEPNLKALTSRIVELTRRRQLHQVQFNIGFILLNFCSHCFY